MTRYEYIKSLNESELANWLCEEFNHAQVECENCPAYRHCYKGHNGMKHWLMRDMDESKRQDDSDIDAVSVRFIIDWLNKGGEDKISSCLKEWEKQNETSRKD